jgi:energy-coupling factor transporter ATP-binding protein EcfA2
MIQIWVPDAKSILMKPNAPRARIEELRISGFRAFENARLQFDDLTVLVGHNGSGKSTLIDALEFVRDALSDSLENALERRGGLQALLHRGPRSKDLSVAVKLRLPPGPWLRARGPLYDLVEMPSVADAPLPPEPTATYGFRLGPKRGGLGFVVKAESARGNTDHLPAVSLPSQPSSALGLPLVANMDPLFGALLDALRTGIRAYNLSPAAIRAEPPIGRAGILSRSGDNAGDVLYHLQRHKEDLDWIVRHLSSIIPDVVDIKARAAAGRRLIQFIQRRSGKSISRFNIGDMSDGTLRCLAVLLALRQNPTPMLTCIEEVEDSVHPAALGVLLDAISSSTERGQVLLTSHSPEVLSHPAITPERVRLVGWRNGRSQIFHPSPGTRKMSTPPRSVGSLLRANALFPAKTPELIEGDIFKVP